MSTAQTTYLLSVPGTDQTRELTREGLLKELVRGEITPEYWVWSPEHNDWKQISDLPALRAAPAKAIVQTPTSAPKSDRESGLKETLHFSKGAPEPTAATTPAVPVKASPVLTVKQNPSLSVGAGSTAATPKSSPALTVRPNPPVAAQSAAAASPAPAAAKANVPTLPPAGFVPPASAAPLIAPIRAGVPPLPQAASAPAAKSPPQLTPKVPALPAKAAPALGKTAAPPIGKNVVYEAPKVRVKKRRLVKPVRDPRVHEDGTISYPALVFGFLWAAVAGIVGANYVMVDKPMDESLAHTSFVLVPTHAHLGSFVQPNALVIHILPSPELTEKNLADYLQVVAKSTPTQPFRSGTPFDTVALTSAWFGQYALTGTDWQALGKMTDAKTEERREFITDHLCTVAGQPLIHRDANLGGANLDAERDKVWQDLTAHFAAHS